ncbi:unnamed protein product [Trichogramma brassicae]|uniref:Uncharacterized protein n=1 Tax=Trichogramma brassicae TaxID=86971 RepID=A0A6H5IUS2_9HYME|nr:unnamed protein product [Trichogramma brassicae]
MEGVARGLVSTSPINDIYRGPVRPRGNSHFNFYGTRSLCHLCTSVIVTFRGYRLSYSTRVAYTGYGHNLGRGDRIHRSLSISRFMKEVTKKITIENRQLQREGDRKRWSYSYSADQQRESVFVGDISTCTNQQQKFLLSLLHNLFQARDEVLVIHLVHLILKEEEYYGRCNYNKLPIQLHELCLEQTRMVRNEVPFLKKGLETIFLRTFPIRNIDESGESTKYTSWILRAFSRTSPKSTRIKKKINVDQ